MVSPATLIAAIKQYASFNERYCSAHTEHSMYLCLWHFECAAFSAPNREKLVESQAEENEPIADNEQ